MHRITDHYETNRKLTIVDRTTNSKHTRMRHDLIRQCRHNPPPAVADMKVVGGHCIEYGSTKNNGCALTMDYTT